MSTQPPAPPAVRVATHPDGRVVAIATVPVRERHAPGVAWLVGRRRAQRATKATATSRNEVQS